MSSQRLSRKRKELYQRLREFVETYIELKTMECRAGLPMPNRRPRRIGKRLTGRHSPEDLLVNRNNYHDIGTAVSRTLMWMRKDGVEDELP